MTLSPVRFVEAREGCVFAVKKLPSTAMTFVSDILLYRAVPAAGFEGDWLAGMLSCMPISSRLTIFAFGGSAGHREYRRRAREPARAQDVLMPRPAALSLPLNSACPGASDIELGILTVIFGGKELVTRACVCAAWLLTMPLQGTLRRWLELMDKYCVRDAPCLYACCSGFEGPPARDYCLCFHPIKILKGVYCVPREPAQGTRKAVWLPPTAPLP